MFRGGDKTRTIVEGLLGRLLFLETSHVFGNEWETSVQNFLSHTNYKPQVFGTAKSATRLVKNLPQGKGKRKDGQWVAYIAPPPGVAKITVGGGGIRPENRSSDRFQEVEAVAQNIIEQHGGDLDSIVVPVLPNEKAFDGNDHPPITPVRIGDFRDFKYGIRFEIFEIICLHFVAHMSPEVPYDEITITAKVEDELGKPQLSSALTDAYIKDRGADDQVPDPNALTAVYHHVLKGSFLKVSGFEHMGDFLNPVQPGRVDEIAFFTGSETVLDPKKNMGGKIIVEEKEIWSVPPALLTEAEAIDMMHKAGRGHLPGAYNPDHGIGYC